MKVFALPESVPAPQVDYMNYNRDKVIAAEAAHKAALKRHLIEAGYTGEHTGEIAQFSVADGYALYMLGEGAGHGRDILIHLPYGDAYRYLHIEHLPKSAILDTIAHRQKIDALFALPGR